MCRSRRELSNEYLVVKIGFDTAENEPCKVCPLSVYSSLRASRVSSSCRRSTLWFLVSWTNFCTWAVQFQNYDSQGRRVIFQATTLPTPSLHPISAKHLKIIAHLCKIHQLPATESLRDFQQSGNIPQNVRRKLTDFDYISTIF